MSALKDAMKNEYTKQILRATGVRKASLEQKKTSHYRMPMLEQAGGWMRLDKYKGPEIPASEWEEPDVHDLLERSDHVLRADHLGHR